MSNTTYDPLVVSLENLAKAVQKLITTVSKLNTYRPIENPALKFRDLLQSNCKLSMSIRNDMSLFLANRRKPSVLSDLFSMEEWVEKLTIRKFRLTLDRRLALARIFDRICQLVV